VHVGPDGYAITIDPLVAFVSEMLIAICAVAVPLTTTSEMAPPALFPCCVKVPEAVPAPLNVSVIVPL